MRLICFAISMLSLLVMTVTPSRSEENSDFIFPQDGTSFATQVTSAHFSRPISKIAENITVLTATDISRFNAHTLADILQTIPGLQLDQVQTPGAWTSVNLHNSTSKHIQLLIDGVPQNFIASDNTAEAYMIPVQMIERIEVIKGVASVAWGQALGGVINVITKQPKPDSTVSGSSSASIGDHRTSDFKGELSGTMDRFGYYLSGGNLYSKGLVTGTRNNFNNFFGKLSYKLPSRSTITFGLDFRDGRRGLEDIPPPTDYRDSAASRYGSATIAFTSPLSSQFLLEMNGWLGQRQQTTQWGAFTTTDLFRDLKLLENFNGARTRLFWGDDKANLTTGIDYDFSGNNSTDPTTPPLNYTMSLRHLGAYLNGTYTLGSLTILPGFRHDSYDHVNNAKTFSLGTTWKLSEYTLLRAYAAKGYSLPALDPAYLDITKLQDIYTFQSGIESNAVPNIWLKGTYFYSSLSNIQDLATGSLQGQIKQGVELEVKSSSLYGFRFGGGYTFTKSNDKSTGEKLKTDLGQSAPPHGVKAILNYDNSQLGLRGTLTGNYIKWNSINADTHDKPVIWDLHLNQMLSPGKEFSPELFFSVRNLFNGSQYQREIRPNTPRWIEGGVRFSF